MILLRYTQNCRCYKLGSLPVTLLWDFLTPCLTAQTSLSRSTTPSKNGGRIGRKKAFQHFYWDLTNFWHMLWENSSLQLAASGRQGKQHWLLMQTSYREIETVFLLHACLWGVHLKPLSLVSTPRPGFSNSKVGNILKIWSPALKSTADHQTKTNHHQWNHEILSSKGIQSTSKKAGFTKRKPLSPTKLFSQEKK